MIEWWMVVIGFALFFGLVWLYVKWSVGRKMKAMDERLSRPWKQRGVKKGE